MDENISKELPCKDKLAFNTKQEAKTSATVAKYRYGNKLYAYICQHCGLWHLSSTT